MKRILPKLVVTFTLGLIMLNVYQVEAQSFDACQVYGTVYEADSPNDASFTVYLETSEAFADLVVYQEDNRLMANESGHWFFTDKPAFAHFSIYFVNKRGLADFSIFYTETLSFAGCK